MSYHNKRESLLLLLGDIGIFFLALWVTLCVRYWGFPDSELFGAHFAPFLILSIAWVVVFFIAGLYDKHTEFVKRGMLSTITNAQMVNAALAALFFFFIPYFGITPKTNLLIYFVISSAALLVWRLLLVEYLMPKTRRKALLVGEGEEIEDLVREVNSNSRYGITFVRILNAEMLSETRDLENKVRLLVEKENISIIVGDTRNPEITKLVPLLFTLTFSDKSMRFIDFHAMYEEIFDRVPVSMLHYEWFLAHVTRSAQPVYSFLKRIIDIVGASLLGIVLLCIIPLVWCAIRIEDKGPLFIAQRRMGIAGTVITVYKFRTMSSNENGVWLGESKNRVTKVGALLRKTSIDELPQVLTILKGEMSLIGPRNDIEGLALRLGEEIPFYAIRTIIKPGITGWAQTHQQYTPGHISPQSVEETHMRLAYDLFYIKHRSLLLDINIALRTFKTLLGRFGVTIRLR
ncbi:sugar transferase [Patescibacteria group bacterium]|nr:sugar transferase [Patescibacteria group bacterium]